MAGRYLGDLFPGFVHWGCRVFRRVHYVVRPEDKVVRSGDEETIS